MASKGQQHNHKVISFSPAWCLRPSPTNDSSPRTVLPPSNHSKNKKSRSQSQSPKFTTEPTSPRIGCMGQVRRRKSPPSVAASSSSSASPSPNFTRQFSLLLIKRVVSSKILLREMDPPRPVERKGVREVNTVSLWKRRSTRADSLKLQLQPEEH